MFGWVPPGHGQRCRLRYSKVCTSMALLCRPGVEVCMFREGGQGAVHNMVDASTVLRFHMHSNELRPPLPPCTLMMVEAAAACLDGG